MPQVRHAQLGEGGRIATMMLAQHQGRVHKLAFEPGSPHIFYSCGEDGLVQHVSFRFIYSVCNFTSFCCLMLF